MRVDAQVLWRAVKNVSLFSREKGWAQATKFEVDMRAEFLRITTSDDFVGIRSQVPLPEDGLRPFSFYLSHKDLKELEKFLREKSGEVDISLNEAGLRVEHEDVVNYSETKECPDQEWWEMFEFVMGHVNAFPEALPSWALDPARLAKMNLLEPKGEYPLALSTCDLQGQTFVAFKYGPDTAGMISPLRREALEEAYGDKIDEVLW